MDDEIKIDLRPMIEALILRWRVVVGAPAVVVFIALVLILTLPRTYEARAYVAVSKQKVNVQFGTEIHTLTEEELMMNGTTGAQTLVDRAARLETFRELATNPAIGEKVLPQFADRLRELDEDLLNTSRFLTDHVSVDQNTKSDLIGIVISLRDPVLAADIANAWAQAYEEHINRLYSSATAADVQAVRAQADQSEQEYAAVQQEFEAYLADNPVPRLDKQITILQTQIDNYQAALTVAEALVKSHELDVRRQLLNGYYLDLVTLESLLRDARLLQKQIENGETSSAAAFGDTLAMTFLRSRAFSGGAAPFSMQLQTPLSAGPVAASDVAGLILTLEQRKTETEAAIEELTATLLDPPAHQLPQDAGAEIRDSIEKWTVELQALQAQLEAEEAHRKDLERQRNLAWSTYSQLASKTVEVGVAANSSGTEVRVASQSLPPVEPALSGLSIFIITGLGSFVLTIFAVLVFDWWQKRMRGETLEPVLSSKRKSGKAFLGK